MKEKNFNLIILVAFLCSLILGVSMNRIIEKKTNEIKVLKSEIKTQREVIHYLEKQKDTAEAIIKTAYDSAVKFEMLVGVKEPDGIVSYKEKLLTTSKRMNRIKNSSKTNINLN